MSATARTTTSPHAADRFILSDSTYHGAGVLHGGNHRTAQIHELSARAGFSLSYVDRSLPSDNAPSYLSGFSFLFRHWLAFRPASSMTWRKWRINHTYYRHAFARHSGAKLLLWEVTEPANWIAPHAARDFRFRVLAVPQNIESLVPDSTHGLSLAQEIRHLARADAIFCISREEQALLQQHGLDADFLPYHPPAAMMSTLLQVRTRRQQQATRHGILLLGTAHNPPTKAGMIEILDWFRHGRLPDNVTVDIAGLGTEELKSYLPEKGFNLHGTVSAQQLEELLLNTRAMLAHQPQGCGALTRIPEMLAAGVPVLANRIAARSATHFEGVHVYDTAERLAGQLGALLEKDWPVPTVPAAPQAAESAFISKIKELAG